MLKLLDRYNSEIYLVISQAYCNVLFGAPWFTSYLTSPRKVSLRPQAAHRRHHHCGVYRYKSKQCIADLNSHAASYTLPAAHIVRYTLPTAHAERYALPTAHAERYLLPAAHSARYTLPASHAAGYALPAAPAARHTLLRQSQWRSCPTRSQQASSFANYATASSTTLVKYRCGRPR